MPDGGTANVSVTDLDTSRVCIEIADQGGSLGGRVSGILLRSIVVAERDVGWFGARQNMRIIELHRENFTSKSVLAVELLRGSS